MLRKLCEKYTDLPHEDICTLEDMEKYIKIISDLVRADIFIDCLIKSSDKAIVVGEAKPPNNLSLYKNSVVGKLALRENEPAALRTLEVGMGTSDLKAVTQENRVVKQNTVPIKNKVDRVIGVLIMERDVTEDVSKNRNMEILSETTEQLTETIMNFSQPHLQNSLDFNLINDAIVIFDKNGYSIYANYIAENLYKKLGYKDKIIGMKFHNLVLSKINFINIISKNKSISSEVTVGKFSLQIKYALAKTSNGGLGVIMLIKDITDIREKEKEIVLKSVAIREIHHRVKNNLQTIASILRLQSRRIENTQAKKAFNDSIGRILSIAATHEVLAKNGIDDVDIKNILDKIKNNAIRSSIQNNKNIIINLIGDSFYVNSDKATSIAIIINELLSNAFEHAFVYKDEGYIEIVINRGIMYSNISVIDNGIGFDIKSAKHQSLGLDIVKSMVKDKLNGDINIESNNSGTKIIFSFLIS
ncbi:sensor histidine kinase [Clostridium tyrobutyricum]|uniref:sensor histidine kinase n=1 Tax=Clostridium tyrobutyricum TaxID=1519 RepID=UPI0002D567B1|nr:sensor histidine kinase [Clostridium tyrobutyricum]MEA5008012.1 sensor histidine kinase [Clostridium tyrobutyricum]